MRFKIFGDLHLTLDKVINKPIFDFLNNNVDKEDILIFLGDIFDTFDISVKNIEFYEWLQKIQNTVYIITGNHDYSKNRSAWKVVKPFTERINIIENYQYFDIFGYRFHFKNYFKDLSNPLSPVENMKNILFTHMDLNPKNPVNIVKPFDWVISGHIHDFEMVKKYITLGAVRQCKINESKKKKYMVIDIDDNEFNFKFVDFESVIDIKESFVRDLRKLKIDKNTILKVLLNGYQDEKDIMKQLETVDWYDKEKVIIKFSKYVDNKVITGILNNIDDSKIDLNNIFKLYLDDYVTKFKDKDLNVDLMKKMFNYIYDKEIDLLKDIFNSYSVNFNNIELKNFKLFREQFIDFSKYSNITSIEGHNHDESDNMIASNEAGKSNIRSSLEYAILGTSSEVKPLRRGEKSGFVRLNFDINEDNIILERKFTKTTNDVNIRINNEDFHLQETPSDKMSLFFERYKIKDAVSFFLISDTGLAKYFFSSKNSERFKLFRNIFPIIDNISQFILKVKEYTNNKQQDFSIIADKYTNIVEERKALAINYWQQFFELQNQILEIEKKNQILEIEKEKIKINEKLLEKKDNIKSILDLCADDNIFKIYDIYKSIPDTKNILEDYKNFESINQNRERYNSNIIDLEKKYKESMSVLSNLKKEYNDLLSEDSEFDKIILSLDLEFIKRKYEQVEVFKQIEVLDGIDKFDDYNKIYDSKIEGDIQGFNIEIKRLTNNMLRLKEEYIELEGRKKELKTISCPNCNYEIKDENSLNFIIEQQKKIKSKGKEFKDERDILDKKIVEKKEELNKIKVLRNNINNILSQNNINITDFFMYINDKDNYIDCEYTYEDVCQNIENKRISEEIFKKLEKIEYKVDIETNNINNIKEGIASLHDSLNKLEDINFDIDKYNNIIKLLNNNNLSEFDYYISESNIKKILSYKIVKDVTVDTFEKLVKKYNTILEMEKKFIRITEINTELKYHKEKEKELLNLLTDFSNKLRQDNKKLSLKDIKVNYIKLEKEYKDLNILYKVMTSKRSFNFEKYFINQFFLKFSDIFNSFLKVLFNRHVELNVSENNFLFTDGQYNEIPFRDFSNGAKSKIQIVLMATITMLFENYGVASKLLLLDEFIDQGLDENAISRVMEMLRQFFIKNRKIFIISHKEISDYVDNRIIVERKMGRSKIL